jgi:hypothetical protein
MATIKACVLLLADEEIIGVCYIESGARFVHTHAPSSLLLVASFVGTQEKKTTIMRLRCDKYESEEVCIGG